MPFGADDVRWLIHIPKADLAAILLWAAEHVADESGSFTQEAAQDWLMAQDRAVVEAKLTELRGELDARTTDRAHRPNPETARWN